MLEKYRPVCYYWELVILARKLLIAFPGLYLTTRYVENFTAQIIINLFFLIATVYYRPYLTDVEFFQYNRQENDADTLKHKGLMKWFGGLKKRYGVNIMLDVLLIVAEIFMAIGALITAATRAELEKNSGENLGKDRSAILKGMSSKYPFMTAVGAAFEITGVVMFVLVQKSLRLGRINPLNNQRRRAKRRSRR